MLYLNQTVRVQPSQMQAYVEQFKSSLTPLMQRQGIELVGLWQALHANDFIDLWEVREWSDLDRLDTAMKENAEFRTYSSRPTRSVRAGVSNTCFRHRFVRTSRASSASRSKAVSTCSRLFRSFRTGSRSI